MEEQSIILPKCHFTGVAYAMKVAMDDVMTMDYSTMRSRQIMSYEIGTYGNTGRPQYPQATAKLFSI